MGFSPAIPQRYPSHFCHSWTLPFNAPANDPTNLFFDLLFYLFFLLVLEIGGPRG